MAVDRRQNRHVIIGAVIVLLMIALPILVLFIPDFIRSLRSSTEIVVVMPEAGVLEANSPVWIAGREVGSVMHVELRPGDVDSTERVAVRMSIPREYLTHIRKNSEVRITSDGLMGAPALDILPGSPGAPEVEENDTLHIRTSGTLEGILDATTALSESFEILFADLRSMERVVSSGRQRQMQRLSRNLTTTMTEFRTLVVTLRSSPLNTLTDPEFERTIASLQTRSTQLAEALRGAAGRAGQARSDMQPTLERLTARADTIQSVLADIQERIDAGGGGLLIRAQKDTAIVKALHETQVQLDSLIAESTRNPLRFWF